VFMGKHDYETIALGNVFSFKLPNGKYAFGRVYKDTAAAIYNKFSDDPHDAPIGCRDFLFNVGFAEEELCNGQCQVIGNDPFSDIEDAWPPPVYIYCEASNSYCILHKGKVCEASWEECRDLSDASILPLEKLIEKVLDYTYEEVAC
jgi:hypothetical protein